MSSATPQSLAVCYVRQVRRRMWLQRLLHGLLLGWAGAFALATLFFFIRSLIWGRLSQEDGWIFFGSAAGVGTVFGVFWAWRRAPSTVESALALDDRFALKERVTTLLCLTPGEATTPAGQALQEDVQQKMVLLNVAERFPVRLPLNQALMPLLAATLALLALFFTPQLDFSRVSASDNARKSQLASSEEAQKQLDQLGKDLADKNKKDLAMSKEEQELGQKIKEMLEKDAEAKDESQKRQTMEAIRQIEDKMKDRIDDLKERSLKQNDAKRALEQLDKLAKKAKKEGPAKELQDALSKGNMKKAQQELDKIREKLEKKEITKDEKADLMENLEEARRELERLHNQQDLRDELKRQFEQGKIDREEKEKLERELDQMRDNLAELKELADLLKDLEDALDGDPNDLKNLKDLKDFKGKLERFRGKLEKLDLDKEELDRLLREAERLGVARLALMRAAQRNGPGNVPGPAPGTGPGNGPRASGPETDTTSVNKRQRGDTDERGKLRISGYAKGGTFSKISAKDIPAAFRQAEQDASQVLDRQRIPADAADLSKRYFENLGGQK